MNIHEINEIEEKIKEQIYDRRLRDQIAMAALNGFASRMNYYKILEEDYCRKAYLLADTMMKARGGDNE